MTIDPIFLPTTLNLRTITYNTQPYSSHLQHSTLNTLNSIPPTLLPSDLEHSFKHIAYNPQHSPRFCPQLTTVWLNHTNTKTNHTTFINKSLTTSTIYPQHTTVPTQHEYTKTNHYNLLLKRLQHSTHHNYWTPLANNRTKKIETKNYLTETYI